jgi:hypothetical protein
MRRHAVIKGEQGTRRPDWIQIVLGAWVILGLIVLVLVIVHSMP